MSPSLGPVRYAGEQLQYLSGAVEDNSQISQDTRHLIDQEVQKMVTEQYERARALLAAHSTAVETLARELLEEETVDGKAVARALDGDGARRSAPDAGRKDGAIQAAGSRRQASVDEGPRPTRRTGEFAGVAFAEYAEQPAITGRLTVAKEEIWKR